MKKYTLIIIALIAVFQLKAQSTIYVNANASGSNDGSSWTNAYTNLQTALDNASKGDSIWVAAATYKPSKDKTGNSSPADNRTKTFQLVDSVSLFGGFAGTESSFNERDWKTNETILSGDIGVSDDISDNCYHVVTGADSLQLNGFTITKGYASGGTSDDGHGGGIFLKNVSEFKLDFCIVKDNIASTGGGGMVISYCDSIEISNSIFLRDSVSWQGGAIQNGESSLTITNSSFIKNTASLPSRGWGGAIYNVNAGATIDISNCTFIQNVAPRGEAIARYNTSSNVSVINSILWQTKEGEIRGDCDVTYSVIRQEAYASNEGCIGDDPLLYLAGDNDLRIHELSTALDAGDPAFPLDPDGSRADIGAPWTIFSPETELFVADISTSIGQYVYGENEITATITNRGASTVTAMDIEWEVNGIPQTTINWTGSLGSMSTTDPVNLGTCNLNFGDNTIKVITANPTPGPDDYTGNDTLQITVDAETNLDIGIVSVVEPLNPFTHGVNDVRILFKNYSNDSTITSADIDFEIDDVAQTTYNWTGTLLPGEISDTVTILANNFFTEANHTIKVWTVDPNSNFDDDNTNDTLQVSVNGCNPLDGGTYTIGSGGDYSTFTDAINYLTSTCGIKGAFVFNVLSDTYNEQITIPEIPGMSEDHTITFQSATGDSTDVTLTYAATGEGDNYTLKLDGADYITFKDITIEATGTNYARVVEIGDKAHYNTFTNNHLLGVSGKSELVYSYNSYDTCNVFTNNLFSNGIHGINMQQGYQLVVSGNKFLNQTEKAISLTYYLYPEILSNYIHSDTRLTSAIYLDGSRDQVKINNNQIILPFGGSGVRLEYCRLATTTDTSEIFNNHIYINTEEQNDYGIYMYLYASNIKIFHNTVHMNGNNPASSCYTFGSSDPFNFKLLNNNLVNRAGGYAIYRSYNYEGVYTSNYNNLYTNGGIFAKYRWSSLADFDAWQTETGKDLNSVSVDPYFVEDTSYHVLHPALNGAGTPLTEVTEDLDGESRDATHPDMGADEFSISPAPLSGIYTIAGTSPNYETINDAVQDLIINGIDGAVTFNIASGTLTEQVMIPEIPGASSTNTITFQSATGDSSDVLITYTPDNTTHKNTIRLDGADYITFKNLSIASGEEWGWPVELRSKATHNTFEGNKIFMATQASANDEYALVYAKGSLDSSNVFIGNHFENGSIGIYLEGCGSGTQIVNNTFTNMSHRGINLRSSNNPEIIGNHIDFTDTGDHGIYLATLNNPKIVGNYIYNAVSGIRFWKVHGTDTEKGVIVNNMIINSTLTGISLAYSNYLLVAYNTVKINANTYSQYSHAFYGTGNNFDILNNIFVLNQGSYAAEISDTTACSIDYNLYYHSNAAYADMYYSTGHTTDIEQYGFDLHSISREPEFISDTDLHTRDAWISNLGTPLTEVTTDIDGEPRDITHPDIGADEYEAEILFSGEYTIGSGEDFETFTEAVDSITEVGAIGSVIFNVMSGTYDEQFIVPSIPHVMDTITVTFQSATGDSSDVILQFDGTASDYYTVRMDACSYITFQNMTIKALNTTYASAIKFAEGASNNILSNNVLVGNGTVYPVVHSDGKENNNNQIINNLIKDGNVGVQMYGESTTVRESGTQIIGNVFENQNETAIALKWNSSTTLSKNYITHPELLSAQEQWTGIYMTDCSTGLIANNSISFNTETDAGGIVLYGSSDQKVYHNSVNIVGSSNNSRVFNQQNGGSGNHLYNNIFSNKSGGMVLFIRDINAITSDHNNYYSNGDRFIYYGASDTESYWINDLETWQSDYSKDLNSVSVNPQFASEMDLLPTNIVLDGMGTPLTEITEDIEGTERDTEYPDVGAYEFDGCTISGTFTIGATGADYSTFEDAIESLQTCWVDGPIVFNVQSGTYNEQLIIPEIPRLSETNTITFQSITGDSTDVILSYESSHVDTNYTVKLDGADFIRFKNMTIQATGSDYANVVEISGGASNNHFHNNRFIGINTTDPSNTDGVLVFSPYGSVLDSNTVFNDNLFLSGSYGIYLNAHNSNYEKNNQITSNRFENQVSYAISLNYQDFALISQNEILNTSSDNEYYGIYFIGKNSLINKNRININTDNASNTGLYFQSEANSILSNNFIHVKRGTGMELYNGKVFHNSVNISGDNIYGSAVVMKNWSENACNFKNNIVQNNARGKAINCGSTALAGVISDYNNLYSNGEYLARTDNNIIDLAEWTSTSLLDAHSISVDTKFESDSNLYTKNPVINNSGTPLAEVTDDIDGNIRDAATPDIGASEFSQTEYLLDADTIHACAYDTVTLDAGNGYDTYSWSNGEDTQFTKIDTTGIGLNGIKLFSIVMVNGQEYTDSVWVSFHQPVASTFDVDTCAYSTVDLVASGGVSYHWDTYGDTCCISTYLNDEIRNIVVTVYDAYGCYDTDTATLTPYSKPSQPYIYKDNDSLFCDTDGTNYEWYLNSAIIQNTTQTIDPPESGDYQVIVYNNVCPSDISDIYSYTAPTGIVDFEDNLGMKLYPNPTNGLLFINFEKSFENLSLDLFSSDGKKILTKQLENIEKGDTEEFDLGDFPKGLYFIRFSNNNISKTARILVQ